MNLNQPVQIKLFYNDFVTPILVPDSIIESIQIKQDYLNPTTNFSVVLVGENSIQNYTTPTTLDIRAKIYINDYPICMGYLSDTHKSSSKSSGNIITYHFKSMCGILEKMKIQPSVSFTGQETLEQITDAVISTSVAPFLPNFVFNFVDDSSQISYRTAQSVSTFASTHRLKHQNPLKDIQPTAGESVYSFLQKLYHRAGCHLRDVCSAKTGLPIFVVDQPQLPQSLDFYGDIIINKKQGQISTTLVTDVQETIKNEIPAYLLGWSHSFGNDMSSIFKSSPIKALIINPLFKTNPTLIANLSNILLQNFAPTSGPPSPTAVASAVSDLLKPQPNDSFINPFRTKFCSTLIFPDYKYESDCTTQEQLGNKITSKVNLEIYSGYSLEYSLVNFYNNPSNKISFYYPDQNVNIIDPHTFQGGDFTVYQMWVASVDTSFSKSSGLVQKVNCRIPGTLQFEEEI